MFSMQPTRPRLEKVPAPDQVISMSNYTRGASFEREICKHLRVAGYLAARSAGSHGIGDVIALTPLRYNVNADTYDMQPSLLIQAKIGGVISKAECQELIDASTRTGATPLIAYRPTERGKTRIGMAFKTWDGKRWMIWEP